MRRSLVGLLLLGASALPAQAATLARSTFATLPDGRKVEAVELGNAKGMRVTLLAWGATIQRLETPDRTGNSADVVLGYPDMTGYLAKSNYFGASIGRFANRIAGARFMLDGAQYRLAANDGQNSLHGGFGGFDKRLWAIAATAADRASASVTFTYTSPAGEEGYPGELKVTATYTLNEDNVLALEYLATTNEPTVVNLTGHTYFNLAGEASRHSVMGEWLTIPAETFTPVDASLIPTGEFRAVAGTPFDFRASAEIGARIRDGRDQQLLIARGYDHNWVIARTPDTALRLDARLEDRDTGRALEVWSNQPGIQFYSGNFLDGTVAGKSGRIYRQGDGLCLEPQLFPDTPNQPGLGSARLNPGRTYRNRIEYRFSTRR